MRVATTMVLSVSSLTSSDPFSSACRSSCVEGDSPRWSSDTTVYERGSVLLILGERKGTRVGGRSVKEKGGWGMEGREMRGAELEMAREVTKRVSN